MAMTLSRSPSWTVVIALSSSMMIWRNHAPLLCIQHRGQYLQSLVINSCTVLYKVYHNSSHLPLLLAFLPTQRSTTSVSCNQKMYNNIHGIPQLSRLPLLLGFNPTQRSMPSVSCELQLHNIIHSIPQFAHLPLLLALHPTQRSVSSVSCKQQLQCCT